jgi:hypothetical protein
MKLFESGTISFSFSMFLFTRWIEYKLYYIVSIINMETSGSSAFVGPLQYSWHFKNVGPLNSIYEVVLCGYTLVHIFILISTKNSPIKRKKIVKKKVTPLTQIHIIIIIRKRTQQHSSYLFKDEVNLSLGFHKLFWPFTQDMCG